MKELYPDYPCTYCTKTYTNCRAGCFRWRKWFRVTWRKLADELKEAKNK